MEMKRKQTDFLFIEIKGEKHMKIKSLFMRQLHSYRLASDKQIITALLRRHNGNVTHAAKEAGIDRSNLLRLIRSVGLKADSFRHA